MWKNKQCVRRKTNDSVCVCVLDPPKQTLRGVFVDALFGVLRAQTLTPYCWFNVITLFDSEIYAGATVAVTTCTHFHAGHYVTKATV